MRPAVLVVVLAGCGRLSFDATDDSGTPNGDGRVVDVMRGDGEVPPACVATRVDVALAPPIADIVAAPTPGGYSLGFITAPSSILSGIFVSEALNPNTSTPTRTSPITALAITYTRASMYWTGNQLVGAVSVAEDGNCYKKVFPTDMSLYTYADSGMQCRTGEPSVASAGSDVLSTWYVGSQHFYARLQANGQEQPPNTSGGAVIGTITDTSIASGETNAVLIAALSGGTCELRRFPAASGQSLSADGCTRPHIVPAGPAAWHVIHENGAALTLRSITDPGGGMNLVVSTPTDVGLGSHPRLFQSGGTWLAAFAKTTGLGIRGIDPVVELPISGLPAPAPDALEVAGPYVFAAYGADLYAIACP